MGRARKFHNDYYKTKRKARIAKRNGWPMDKPNKFNKGKIHCSCHMCRPGSYKETRQWKRAEDSLEYFNKNEKDIEKE